MTTFNQRRKWIRSLQEFRPGMEETRGQYPPIDLLLLALLTLVGTATVLFFIGIGLKNLYDLL